MPQTKNKWNSFQIKLCNEKLGQALLHDEQTLALFCNDFGKLTHSNPAAIFEPETTESAQLLIQYAHENGLPVTLRGNGMSQSGQSLAVPGGLILNMKHFDSISEVEAYSIWVEANTSWSTVLEKTLPHSLIPYVVPHNCNLSVGGVISAGGIGASSFKYGSVTAHVNSLKIVQANGELIQTDAQSPLMQACLGGQGRFGLITQANIALRPCSKFVRTFFLVYLDKEAWLNDLLLCRTNADFIESFCTSAIQGAKLSEKGRLPFAQWLYAIHVSIEYNDFAPDFSNLGVHPWRLVHTQDESIHSYLHRHDSRFNVMKMTGQWELQHPWYECFIPGSQLESLEKLLDTLPIHYAPVVHITPVAPVSPTGFLQFPKSEHIFALMILNPGLPEVFIPSCLQTIKHLDAIFLPNGGKRYLSGYLGESPKKQFWQSHFEERYEDWICLKKRYDPQNIFCSFLHR
ncbi:cytokinin oxidase [Legionella gratiana]|uniref:Cytokinin oxidase n=1 Tax=Legionella gratiana TaxID=45066 RepID=A0A378J2B7_9GAMM|nr:FAD-binding protein [Legionella gratiana]KTD14542.1 cytokinin oxidase [Legionella gratiana]STX41892.1 cytokinin oxidase [Legionella gratiana]